jgi:hypothetical protein
MILPTKMQMAARGWEATAAELGDLIRLGELPDIE